MSRTYRKPKWGRIPFPKMYYLNKPLVDSVERVRGLFRTVGNGHPFEGIPYSEWPDAARTEYARTRDIQLAHHHVFRNRSSYRQRINAIRITKKTEHHKERSQQKRETMKLLYEYWSDEC